MAAHTRTRRSLSAKKAHAARFHPDRDTTDLDRALKFEGAREYVTRLVDTFPPLTDEQVGKLSAILRGSRPDAA